MTITSDVENYPGFADVVQGPWLMAQMQKQAEHVGTEIISDIITEVAFARRPLLLKGDRGTTYNADALPIAPGAAARSQGPPVAPSIKDGGPYAGANTDRP